MVKYYKMDTLDKACRHLYDKTLGEIVMVGEHDVGAYVTGMCNLARQPCTLYIPDYPPDFEYDHTTCERACLKKINR